MNWQGKALGALIGTLAAGPVGALFGAFIGHLYDAQVDGAGRAGAESEPISAQRVQEAYFRAVFQVMGRLAKADGRVSEQEIRAARAVMSELHLGERETRLAMELFRQGKSADFPLEETLQELRRVCQNRSDLRRMFVQIQLQAALWGESLNPAGRGVLARVCAALDVSPYELVQMEALLRMQRPSASPGAGRRSHEQIAQAYAVLGVSSEASDAEVTKAYRRLMNQNHPDKLHAKGLPESMMQLAAEKTRRIREAYELLRRARSMR
ncbi:MAG TPA: co-chaperone DjlA [Steroidobacter sp.]|jgi:DnaJ like chaperone protein|nr:co-chaperone DjlA [Steroidobacteraceae bacterium]HLS81083.1 co-chaperone DjlA [Steroidobacter sp.]